MASNYEQLRMEKLKRNSEIMSKIGLPSTPALPELPLPSSAPKKKVKPLAAATPTRRSSRISKTENSHEDLVELPDPQSWRSKYASSSHQPFNEMEEDDDDETDDVNEAGFEKYSFEAWEAASSSSLITPTTKQEGTTSSSPASSSLLRIDDLEGDPQLKKIYSMHFHPSYPRVIALGGHGGRVALFHEKELKLSFQATNAWISTVRFIAESNLLVTSSNDGKICGFDPSLVQQGMTPKKVFASKVDKETKGLFCMDTVGVSLITAGKDGVICQGEFSPAAAGGISVLNKIKAHDGVCKSVQFKPNESSSNIAVSSGNDAGIRLWDFRLAETSSMVLEFTSRFGLAVNSTQFNPSHPHLLCSAGFSSCMEVRDIRFPAQRCLELVGHCGKEERHNSLYRPAFTHQGTRIVASAGGSKQLTVFDSFSGTRSSVVRVGFETSCTAETLGGSTLAVSHGKSVSLFQCV